jgi:hypothetical protein
MDSFVKPGCLGVFGSFKEGALFHGAAKISEADNFVGVAQAAAKFLFHILAGAATGGQDGYQTSSSKEGQCVTHNLCFLLIGH